ncbi:DUF3659 domain-containing protein [Streptomyces longispororuber]|uniref:DUF3659 domain-containing protein n=1 Tax=Streptomyces longispororuber TaxID=68230 RepID=UPI00210CD383|nr:DUF3659 domain-containing protein [Streptomyces longispororuber]MCQ4210992.1 DUF3659 domain-containing protein [Streptomyces longispororuber]
MRARQLVVMSLAVTMCTLASCSDNSEPERNYAIPKDLCGISIDSTLLTPFLPEGKSIVIREEDPVPSQKNCQVNVDGKVAFIASQEWWEDGDTLAQVAEGNPKLDGAEISEDGRLIYSETGAVSSVDPCTSPDHPKYKLFTSIKAYADGRGSPDAMKRLVSAYTKAVKQSDTCTKPG